MEIPRFFQKPKPRNNMEAKNNTTDSNKRVTKSATAEDILGTNNIPKSRMGSPEINSNGHRTIEGKTYVYQTSRNSCYVIDNKYGKLHSMTYIGHELSKKIALEINGNYHFISASTVYNRTKEAIEEGLLDDLVLGGWAGKGKFSISFNQQIQNMEQVEQYLLLKGFKLASKLENVLPVRTMGEILHAKKQRQAQRRKRRKLSILNKFGRWLYQLGKK